MGLLFQNDGFGKFKDVGLLTGFAYDLAGKVHASMGIDAADFDNDGFLDMHTTSFQLELATLYKNIDGILFDFFSISPKDPPAIKSSLHLTS